VHAQPFPAFFSYYSSSTVVQVPGLPEVTEGDASGHVTSGDVTSGHVTSGSSTASLHRKYGFSRTHILLQFMIDFPLLIKT
jgi:hypothetical protein